MRLCSRTCTPIYPWTQILANYYVPSCSIFLDHYAIFLGQVLLIVNFLLLRRQGHAVERGLCFICMNPVRYPQVKQGDGSQKIHSSRQKEWQPEPRGP